MRPLPSNAICAGFLDVRFGDHGVHAVAARQPEALRLLRGRERQDRRFRSTYVGGRVSPDRPRPDRRALHDRRGRHAGRRAEDPAAARPPAPAPPLKDSAPGAGPARRRVERRPAQRRRHERDRQNRSFHSVNRKPSVETFQGNDCLVASRLHYLLLAGLHPRSHPTAQKTRGGDPGLALARRLRGAVLRPGVSTVSSCLCRAGPGRP